MRKSSGELKIAFIGHREERAYEGVRIILKQLQYHFNILFPNRSEIFAINLRLIQNLRKFKPDILHFVISPTYKGIIFAKFIKFLLRSPKLVISAPHPEYKFPSLIKFFKPDLVLTQSSKSTYYYHKLGYTVKRFPNGVDTSKFVNISEEDKNNLRTKFNFTPDEFIILHVASLTDKRNLGTLIKIKEMMKDVTVLITGRPGEEQNSKIIHKLTEAGCIVLIEYFENIEEIYQISDLYIFPTNDQAGCIELPLSILESLSCDIPVLTTRFGAIDDFISNNHIMYYDGVSDAIRKIKKIRNSGINENNTVKDMSFFDWNTLAKKMEVLYSNLP